MRYVAKHNVTYQGRMLTVGEIFEADFAENAKERLVRLGAIQEVKDEPSPIPAPAQETAPQADAAPADTAEQPEDEAGKEPEEDNGDGGMEGMEAAEEKLTIDPMDAVVTQEAPKKKGRRKEG